MLECVPINTKHSLCLELYHPLHLDLLYVTAWGDKCVPISCVLKVPVQLHVSTLAYILILFQECDITGHKRGQSVDDAIFWFRVLICFCLYWTWVLDDLQMDAKYQHRNIDLYIMRYNDFLLCILKKFATRTWLMVLEMLQTGAECRDWETGFFRGMWCIWQVPNEMGHNLL